MHAASRPHQTVNPNERQSRVVTTPRRRTGSAGPRNDCLVSFSLSVFVLSFFFFFTVYTFAVFTRTPVTAVIVTRRVGVQQSDGGWGCGWGVLVFVCLFVCFLLFFFFSTFREAWKTITARREKDKERTKESEGGKQTARFLDRLGFFRRQTRQTVKVTRCV